MRKTLLENNDNLKAETYLKQKKKLKEILNLLV